MKRLLLAVLLLTGIVLSSHAQTSMKNEKTVMVGGAAMYPSKNIVENAMNSADHTTLVTAVKAAGLVETLQGKGPYTVFAPTNAAFNLLPEGTVNNLVKPENKAMLTGILTYHVVPGRLDSKELMKWIKKGNGSTELTTVAGGKLWVMAKDNELWLKDEKGGMAKVEIKDVYQSNGVIHSIDHVLMPK
ncbi:fasciclin domain-containing protein [Flavisolibacter tropicus]|uniref:Fasciclin n=1 Tax=Flavisolibacter tropicus TaxID=1492898 RepID=A0A172TR97_9BACT|nr:fasciclin domain-containing protein [Flavisolibacter tropicus]ANE49595.1 fasciclin [Flavisolibacter tropicus]